MAKAKWLFMKNTLKESHVKIISEGDATLALPLKDLLMPEYQELSDTPLRVLIKAIEWTGEPNSMVRVKRGGERIMTLKAEPNGTLMFDGQQQSAETHNADKDFEFEFLGNAPMEAWFILKKENYKLIDSIQNEIY